MIVTKNFKAYIKKQLLKHSVMDGIAEYERAKRLIIDDMTDDEARQALIIIAEWSGV